MDKEFDNRPDITSGGANIDEPVDTAPEQSAVSDDASPYTDASSGAGAAEDTSAPLVAVENTAEADETEAAQHAEIVFTSDFTVSEVRKRAIKAQKHNLLKAFPKALLYSVLLMVPPLLLFILGMSKAGSSIAAARAIEVIAALVPLVFGGPLFIGLLGGAMDISRGQHFKTGRLFFAFRDNWFFKAIGSYLLFSIAAFIITLICELPAIIVSTLSAGLGDGFAAVATQVIVIILYIGGTVLATQFYLRLALMFPLLIEHPDMKVMEAAKFSIKAMKGNTWKLFLLFLSYIGWYILVIAVGSAIMGGALAAGYAYVMNIFYSGDIYSAYMILLIGITVAYIAAYLIFMIAMSTVIMRPLIGWAAFYDTITGYEPSEDEAIAPEDAAADISNESSEANDPELLPSPEEIPADDITAEVTAEAPVNAENAEPEAGTNNSDVADNNSSNIYE